MAFAITGTTFASLGFHCFRVIEDSKAGGLRTPYSSHSILKVSLAGGRVSVWRQ